MTEERFKTIEHAYIQINSIVSIIEKNDNKIKIERDEIESQLRQEIKVFKGEIKTEEQQVKSFQDLNHTRQSETYVQQIETIIQNLDRLSEQ